MNKKLIAIGIILVFLMAGLSGCINADLNSDSISIKSLRKMCISYLVANKESKYLSLLSSIGHNQITSIEHYLAIPFNDQDKALINQMFYGWGEI